MSTSDSPATEPASSPSSSNGALLELRGVTKRFGPVQALTRINFEVPAGKVTALAGDNGAGKSVTIKTIAGLWPPDEGELVWEGKPVHFHGPGEAEAA
jgi:ABC-type sugar transport system ATPase subunit